MMLIMVMGVGFALLIVIGFIVFFKHIIDTVTNTRCPLCGGQTWHWYRDEAMCCTCGAKYHHSQPPFTPFNLLLQWIARTMLYIIMILILSLIMVPLWSMLRLILSIAQGV